MTKLLRLILVVRQSDPDVFPQKLTKWSQKRSTATKIRAIYSRIALAIKVVHKDGLSQAFNCYDILLD